MLLTLSLNISCAQVHKTDTTIPAKDRAGKPPGPPQPANYVAPHHINRTKFTISQILSKHPLLHSCKIAIISYNLDVDSLSWKQNHDPDARLLDSVQKISDNLVLVDINFLYQSKDLATFHYDKKQILTLAQVDKLSDILYNSCYRWSEWKDKTAGCFRPRNAIIFYDVNEQPFDYIEICFECSSMKSTDKTLKTLPHCNYLYDKLEEYFNLIGIQTKYLPK